MLLQTSVLNLSTLGASNFASFHFRESAFQIPLRLAWSNCTLCSSRLLCTVVISRQAGATFYLSSWNIVNLSCCPSMDIFWLFNLGRKTVAPSAMQFVTLGAMVEK